MAGLANAKGNVELGGGARFWVYISPQHDTAKVVKDWVVAFSQGNWSESITSDDPTKQIQTPNLSGKFDIKITTTDYSTNPVRIIVLQPGEI
jgi:hypothetical protein